jgi:hypothetical protein
MMAIRIQHHDTTVVSEMLSFRSLKLKEYVDFTGV